ncbi:hypothetical protein ABZW96_25390 [Nocardia sp. NPDC004168]
MGQPRQQLAGEDYRSLYDEALALGYEFGPKARLTHLRERVT